MNALHDFKGKRHIRFSSIEEIQSELLLLFTWKKLHQILCTFSVEVFCCCVHELFYRRYYNYMSWYYFKFAWQLMFDLYKLFDLLICFYIYCISFDFILNFNSNCIQTNYRIESNQHYLWFQQKEYVDVVCLKRK